MTARFERLRGVTNNLNETLRKWFEKLERQRRVLLSGLSGLSSLEIRHRPVPSAWSILEVVDHLIKVENAVLAAARAQLPTAAPTKLNDKVGAFFVISLMKSPARVKLPAGASMVLPGSTSDLAEAIEQWIHTREKMADLLKTLQPEKLSLGVFRHPVSGWMTMPQALAFLSAHIRHHEYQLYRLTSAPGCCLRRRFRWVP